MSLDESLPLLLSYLSPLASHTDPIPTSSTSALPQWSPPAVYLDHRPSLYLLPLTPDERPRQS